MNFADCMCQQCTHKKECRQDNMDILFQLMNNENDVTLTDGKGVVLRVSDSYEEHYGVSKAAVIGKTVYELEREHIFNPSVTSAVIKERKKVTLLQTNKLNEKILTTGVPLFDENGELQYVISFNSIDIAEMMTLNDKYHILNELLKEYSREIQLLRMKETEGDTLITKSKAMSDIYDLVLQVAGIDANVLVTGETGVGKSRIARTLHKMSNRSNGPFIEINCGMIPPTLIESELFGYQKGAFTGANDKGKIGKVELANGGTLFLDEIGELPLDMQIKLLQVVQEKVIQRIGGLENIDVDFRLVAATNKDLEKAIIEGHFRQDLYYRLNVIAINIPPLRERTEDIIPLILNFAEKFNYRYNRQVSIAPKVLELMERCPWPGNIRQVENFVERLIVTAKGETVDTEQLPEEFKALAQEPSVEKGSLSDMMEQYEKKIFTMALKKYKTSIAVGKALGIGQTTAARKLRKYVPGYGNKGNIAKNN